MADKDHLILTAVGPDQVGLIEKVSQFIARHGCNIEDSKMAVFCGEFALILLISGESGSLVKIANDQNQYQFPTAALRGNSKRRKHRHRARLDPWRRR